MEREQIISVVPEMTETLISVSVETEETLATVSEVKQPVEYQGVTEVTPTQETQTLRTANLLMPVDIVINPIPQSYGLITWNGSTLTVS